MKTYKDYLNDDSYKGIFNISHIQIEEIDNTSKRYTDTKEILLKLSGLNF
jgi:hypothetical protein